MHTEHTPSPGPATPRVERQEVTLQDIHTDAPITFEKTDLDEVHVTLGGLTRSADVDCGELLIAAQMLAAESDVRPEIDVALSAEIDQFLNGTSSRADLIAMVKQIVGAPDEAFPLKKFGRRCEHKHSARLYRILDEVAAERVRTASQVPECACSACRLGKLMELANGFKAGRSDAIKIASAAVAWVETMTEELA